MRRERACHSCETTKEIFTYFPNNEPTGMSQAFKIQPKLRGKEHCEAKVTTACMRTVAGVLL